MPPEEVALALALPAGAGAVVRRRTMLLDGRPVELTDSWYPPQVATGTALAEPDKIRGGAVTLLAALGYRVHEAREDISVRSVSSEETELLEVPVGSAVITLFRVCLTEAGLPFEASVAVMPAEGRHLRYRLTGGDA
jgi:GntR family transcriptional regulator